MFESTRLKLTAWYLLIIMVVSGFFSLAFYNASTREIQRIIFRIQANEQAGNNALFLPPPRMRGAPPADELEKIKISYQVTLIFINGIILVFSGAAGYFLAGRTLRPIKSMIDEQNQFIANASHELRTPIATLRAELESSLLEKKISDPKARKLIQSNLEEVSTLQDLSNNLLRLAQVHTLSNQTHSNAASVSDVLSIAIKKVKILARKKDISIKTNIQEAVINATSQELSEAFVIILDNAIKYSPKQSTVSVVSNTDAKNVSISIADRGVGISETDLPHIFERFYRADKSRSDTNGFGLGLAISKKIVEAHRGQIEVLSQLGQGTVFTVRLPLA